MWVWSALWGRLAFLTVLAWVPIWGMWFGMTLSERGTDHAHYVVLDIDQPREVVRRSSVWPALHLGPDVIAPIILLAKSRGTVNHTFPHAGSVLQEAYQQEGRHVTLFLFLIIL